MTKGSTFVKEYQELKEAFKWDHNLIKYFGALMAVGEKRQIDAQRIKEIRKYMKEETSVFSQFRGMNELIIALMVWLEPQSEQYFDRTIEVYNELKDSGFKSGTYLPMAALILTKNEKKYAVNSMVERMHQFYDGMKAQHFFLTGQDDYVFAALLAATELNIESTLKLIDDFYHDLNSKGFAKGNPLQSLSHVLVIGDESYDKKLDKLIRLSESFVSKGYKFRDYTMANMGVLALLTDTPEKLVDEVIELSDWLKTNKGFGPMSIDKKTRAVLAGSIIAHQYMDEGDVTFEKAVLANSIQALIIAQQVAMSAAIIATTTAASAST
jgi:hypothetical protein